VNPDLRPDAASPPVPALHPHDAPPPGDLALKLSYAGLLPFIGGALFIWLLAAQEDKTAFVFSVDALAKYAALIISFLGGMTWGLTMRASRHVDTPVAHQALWGGIAYSLAAWVAVCMPAHAGLVVHGALLVACYLGDRKLYPLLGAASWLTLRFRLTTVASLCCFIAAAQT
jgi:Protein of unknown function (DUF3429)